MFRPKSFWTKLNSTKVGVYWTYFVYICASYNIIVLAVIKMQNVKNFIQGKALGVAEYWTPVLKVILHCLRVSGLVTSVFPSILSVAIGLVP